MSSALNTARSTIEALFLSGITATTTKIAWPNVPYEPPADASSFLEPTVLFGESFLGTKGGRNTIFGVLSVNIYGIAGLGMGPIESIADAVRNIFNRVEANGIRYGVPSGPKQVPVVTSLRFRSRPDAKWVQMNITIPFSVDEIV